MLSQFVKSGQEQEKFYRTDYMMLGMWTLDRVFHLRM